MIADCGLSAVLIPLAVAAVGCLWVTYTSQRLKTRNDAVHAFRKWLIDTNYKQYKALPSYEYMLHGKEFTTFQTFEDYRHWHQTVWLPNLGETNASLY